ncbi:MAG: sulfatase [Verrucomicrobiota bacterium]
MSKKTTKSILVLLILFANLYFLDGRNPNVVLIFADDLGYGDVSCYGQEDYSTPHIDRLAREGVLATDYSVPVPFCAPSRGALLTGRVPLRNGLSRNPHPDLTKGHDKVGLNPAEITLAEVYKENGYVTAIFGKWHLGHRPHFYPTRQGFDEYYGILYSNDMPPVQIMENEEVAVKQVDQQYLTRDYTRKSVDFINRNKDTPFFLYIPHPMPHKPLAASEAFYTPDNLYVDVMRELDWSVGQVMQALQENGILEETIVIFTSDNGPFYGGDTGGLRGKKATSWEGGLRVPFIIRYPQSLPQNEIVSTPLWSLDLFPTLLALSNLKPPQDLYLDGKDISLALKGEGLPPRAIFSFNSRGATAMRFGDWKLFLQPPPPMSGGDLNPNWKDPRGPDGVNIIAPYEQPSNDQYPGLKPPIEQITHTALFNLVEDREESKNLADEFPEKVSQMRRLYQEFMDTL